MYLSLSNGQKSEGSLDSAISTLPIVSFGAAGTNESQRSTTDSTGADVASLSECLCFRSRKRSPVNRADTEPCKNIELDHPVAVVCGSWASQVECQPSLRTLMRDVTGLLPT